MRCQKIVLLYVIVLLLSSMNLNAGEIHVDKNNQTGLTNGSAQNPFNTIAEALNVCINGDTIKVAMGTYNENLLIDNKMVFLKGAYLGGSISDYNNGTGGNFYSRDYLLNTTIIAGQNTAAVIEFRNATSGSTIDGFTISGGYRGIYFDSDYTWPPVSNITISNNIIENNGWDDLNDETGGGLQVNGDHIVIEDNIIRQNRAGRGGAMSSQGDSIIFRRNIVDDNYANSDHGGGLYLYGTVHLIGNIISNNRVGVLSGYGWGGGVIFIGTGTGYSVSEGNTYHNNVAPTYGGGVFVDEAATVYMTNDLVYGNRSEDNTHAGAGVAVDESGNNEPSHLYMNNCTVAHNISTNNNTGNGVYVDNTSYATISNSIFRENGGDFKTNTSSQIIVSYSLCDDMITGTGILHGDPLFADVSNDDYHLKSKGGRNTSGGWVIDSEHSPGIDTGNPVSFYQNETSPNGNRINMGCYGNTSEASRSFEMGLYFKKKDNVQILCYPNPFNTTATISIFSTEIQVHSVELFNSNGDLVYYRSEKGVSTNEVKFSIKAIGLSEGVYHAIVKCGNKTIGDTQLVLIK